jgi:cation transport ATPase
MYNGLMVAKKKKDEAGASSVEDLGKDKQEERFKLGITTIVLGISLLVISIMFFYLLSSKTGENFGIVQIIFAIITAIFATAFLRWIKFFMLRNPYLGAIIGIGVLGATIYSLRLKFVGPYTNTFSWIIAIVVLVYLFIHFWKGKKENN